MPIHFHADRLFGKQLLKLDLDEDEEAELKNKVQVQINAQAHKETLTDRGKLYEKRVTDAINNPTGKDEMKNIYFGIVMGISAMIPTAIHISCALFSMRLFFRYGKT